MSVLAHPLQSTGSTAGNKESSHADIRVSVGESVCRVVYDLSRSAGAFDQ